MTDPYRAGPQCRQLLGALGEQQSPAAAFAFGSADTEGHGRKGACMSGPTQLIDISDGSDGQSGILARFLGHDSDRCRVGGKEDYFLDYFLCSHYYLTS